MRNTEQERMMQMLRETFGEVHLAHSGGDVILSVQGQYYGQGRTIGEAADDMVSQIERTRRLVEQVLPRYRL